MTWNAGIPLLILVANIPIYLFIGKKMFGSWSGFWEDFKWHIIPDWWSLLRGRFLRDLLGENKSGLFLILCLLIFGIEIIVVSNFL